MKKKFCLFAALAAMVLVGCKEEEQSELDFGSIKEVATVTGYVTYSLGQDTLSNDYVAEVIKPATGRKVYIDVPKSSYQAGTQGTRTFSGTIGEDGFFSIEVPVKSNGIAGAEIRYESFTANRATYLKMENGQPVFEVLMNKFETPDITVPNPLMPGEIIVGDEREMRYRATPIDMKEYSERVLLTGVFNMPKETAYRVGTYSPASEVTIEFDIVDGQDQKDYAAGQAEQPTVFRYGTTTDASGKFAVSLPVKSLREGFTINELVIYAKGETAFTHYREDGSTTKYRGAYIIRQETPQPTHTVTVSNIPADVEYNMGEMPLEFVPNYSADYESIVIPADYDRDLAGWVFGETAFKEFADKVTLTGKVMVARETGFGVGDYTASKRTVRLYGPSPYNTLTILTNDNGEFSLEIPVAKAAEKVPFSVGVKDPETIAFTHYVAPGKSVVLKEGSYNDYNYAPVQIAEDNADWNNLGTTYCRFTPSGNVPDTWTPFLAGWAKKENCKYTATLTGKVMLAVEKAFGVGEYTPADNRRIAVETETGDTYVALVSNGAYSIYIPVEKENASMSSFNYTLMDNEENAFKHFAQVGKEVKVAGYYNLGTSPIREENADWKDRGTIYCRFIPNSVPGTWANDLAGWAKFNGYNYTATIAGQVKLAKETSFGVGDYTPAANLRVRVYINYDGTAPYSFTTVLTNGAYNFTIPMKSETAQVLPANMWVELMDYEETAFEHYLKDGATQKLLGEYAYSTQVRDNDADWNDMGVYYFRFNPDANVTVKGGWRENLAAWVITQGYNGSVKATGKAFFAVEKAYGIGEYQPANGEIISVYVNNLGQSYDVPVINGSFSLNVPVKNNGDEDILSPSANALSVDNFVHYKAPGSTRILAGDYYPMQIKTSDAAWTDMGEIYYTFTPDASIATYHSNLAGWFKKENYNQSVAVSGSVMLPYETAYAEGAYKAADNAIVTLTMDNDLAGEQFQVVTTGGKFTLNLPVKDVDNKYNPTVSGIELADNAPFVHYKNATKTEKLENGNYYRKYTIKPENAAWNELGTYYFAFQDHSSSNYTENLAGWYVCAPEYVKVGDITGSVLFPQETGFWQGSYKAMANKKVRIDYTTPNENLELIVPTKADGSFSCPAYSRFADDEVSASFTVIDTDEDAFVHYYHNTDGSVKKNLSGYYSNRVIDRKSTAAWNNLGTRYMKFTPNETMEDWSNNLLGWYVMASDDKKATAKFNLFAQKAMETTAANNHEAKWTAAGTQRVTVTIRNTTEWRTYTIQMLSAGQNISFSLPWGSALENGVSQARVTINFDKEEKTTQFRHFPNPYENDNVIVKGKYTDAGNIYNEDVVYNAEGDASFKLKNSAKLLFLPDATPDGWSNYSWSVNDEVL